MKESSHHELSRRERQIMDIIYRRGAASATEVRAAMPDAPGYSAVRAMLRLLENKGHLTHKQDGRKYIFVPTVPAAQARRSALRNLLQTFFDNSVERAVASLLDLKGSDLSEDDLTRLSRLIDEAKKEGDGS